MRKLTLLLSMFLIGTTCYAESYLVRTDGIEVVEFHPSGYKKVMENPKPVESVQNTPEKVQKSVRESTVETRSYYTVDGVYSPDPYNKQHAVHPYTMEKS